MKILKKLLASLMLAGIFVTINLQAMQDATGDSDMDDAAEMLLEISAHSGGSEDSGDSDGSEDVDTPGMQEASANLQLIQEAAAQNATVLPAAQNVGAVIVNTPEYRISLTGKVLRISNNAGQQEEIDLSDPSQVQIYYQGSEVRYGSNLNESNGTAYIVTPRGVLTINITCGNYKNLMEAIAATQQVKIASDNLPENYDFSDVKEYTNTLPNENLLSSEMSISEFLKSTSHDVAAKFQSVLQQYPTATRVVLYTSPVTGIVFIYVGGPAIIGSALIYTGICFAAYNFGVVSRIKSGAEYLSNTRAYTYTTNFLASSSGFAKDTFNSAKARIFGQQSAPLV